MTGQPDVPERPALSTDLPDLSDVPLGDIAAQDAGLDDTLRRIAPADCGRVLLVAASFNSAI